MKKRKFIFQIIFISIFALFIRSLLIKYISGDMRDYLLVWMEQIENNGGIRALSLEIGNYNIIYLFFLAIFTYIPVPGIVSIKMFSIIFDFIIAIAGATIVKHLTKNSEHKNEIFLSSYFILLMLPTIVLNSSLWGQCDSIYTAFIILSIMFLIKEKYLISIIMLGISFSFKLQAVFIFPLFGLIYLGKRKFPFYYFFLIPIINIASWLPALLNGRSFLSCLEIYLGQTQMMNNYINKNFINIYNFIAPSNNTIITDISGTMGYIGIAILVIIFIMISILTIIKKPDIKGESMLLIGIWGVLISAFLLPNMHERYLFLADVLTIIYVITYKKNILTALTINFISLYLYYIYLAADLLVPIPPILMATVYLALVTYLTVEVIYKIIKLNSIKVRVNKQNEGIIKFPNYDINSTAFFGKNGLTKDKKEGDFKTPIGKFKLGMILGMKPRDEIKLDEKLNYKQITKNMYWVDDSKSKYYNQLVDITEVEKDWETAEHLINFPEQYEYLIEIKTNPKNIPEKGSAIFLHCSKKKYTAGCISTDRNTIKEILSKINKKTTIEITSEALKI